jgi:ribonucleoside-diphosphate reductase alpha chain
MKNKKKLKNIKINLSENSLTVLKKRYLRKDENGVAIETPEDLFYRVAKNIALADKIYDNKADIDFLTNEFYTIMTSMDFLPNSPTLINAGGKLQQLSACFVLPIDDSMSSIFETLKNTALIHKSGGGTGFSFSNLRPKNDLVKTTSGVSSGPVSFMHVFNAATEAIKQGGARRGANMAILRIDHPDILEFISCKNENNSLNNFNISVAITKKFMNAVEKKEFYNVYNPRTKKKVFQLNASEVFDKIIFQAWKNGEPGIVFIDSINDKNPIKDGCYIEATNPCGEQPLNSYESCNLGSINLGNFIKKSNVDWVKLENTIKIAVHFLDNVIDMNNYPIKNIGENTRLNRKIGLGVMGWADLLFNLSIPYGSDKSFVLAEQVMKFIQNKSHKFSEKLAVKRGCFPNFEKSIYKNKMRNATTTTIAPTGTIGIIASASSGIEPVFGLIYKRIGLDNNEMYEINKYFEKTLKKEGFYSKKILDEIQKVGSIRDVKEIPQKIKDIFVTSHDISPEKHVKMQASFQKFTDNAVSKTVNFSNSATKEDVKNAYMIAYKMGCKGITVYRDGSRDVQVLNISNSNIDIKKKENEKARVRPAKTKGFTFLMHTGCGKMYVTINEDDTGMCEVFTQLGKSGGCTSSQAEAISRLISLAMRSGVDHNEIISQLNGIRCPSPTFVNGGVILSCADAIAKAMKLYINEKNTPELFHDIKISNYKHEYKKNISSIEYEHNMSGAFPPQCQECGEMITFEESCIVCKFCGYSKCF